MKTLALILLSLGAALGGPVSKKVTPCYTNIYDRTNQEGSYFIIRSYENDLRSLQFNDEICSVKQTGMWMYYENSEYNKNYDGKIYWVHGVDIEFNFPKSHREITSSLKYGGNRYKLNEDSFTLYSGEYFVGDEIYGTSQTTSLSGLSGRGSSLILTGKSPWTFYSGYNYSGYPVCIYPSTDTDVGRNGTVLNFGLYTSLKSVGVVNNSFFSVRKGCYAKEIAFASPMKASHRSKNGAWGVIDLSEMSKDE